MRRKLPHQEFRNKSGSEDVRKRTCDINPRSFSSHTSTKNKTYYNKHNHIMRAFIIITLSFLSLLGYGFYLKASYVEPVVQYGHANAPVKTTATTSPTGTPTETPVRTKPTTNPTAVLLSTCGSGGSCTASEVAMHHMRSNCWVSMGKLGRVYDITDYVMNGSPMHPGGDIIAGYCGQDIYDVFMGNTGDHPHSSSALNNELAPYDIGALK